jgi:hypothetical protein
MSAKRRHSPPTTGTRDAELGAAQHRIRRVARGRGAPVAPALAHELDRRGVARTLSLTDATVSRRNGRGTK